jgi:hypothetical protein
VAQTSDAGHTSKIAVAWRQVQVWHIDREGLGHRGKVLVSSHRVRRVNGLVRERVEVLRCCARVVETFGIRRRRTGRQDHRHRLAGIELHTVLERRAERRANQRTGRNVERKVGTADRSCSRGIEQHGHNAKNERQQQHGGRRGSHVGWVGGGCEEVQNRCKE